MENVSRIILKLSYVGEKDQFCAYLDSKLRFHELKDFIRYWVCVVHKQPPIANVNIFWIDNDGDIIRLRNDEEYKIFEKKCRAEASLRITPGFPWTKDSIKTISFQHACKGCICTKNIYLCNKIGSMACVNCSRNRGFCCLRVLEGVCKAQAEVARALTKPIKAVDKKIVKKDEQTAGTSNRSIASETDKSTSTAMEVCPPQTAINIPQKLFDVAELVVPEQVEKALQIMLAMGFNNDNAWLTRLLLFTDGQISKALQLIKPVIEINER